MINLSIHLYGKPAWDLPIEGEEVTDGKMFKIWGEHLSKHLNQVSTIVETLVKAGWGCYGTLYSLDFSNSKITNQKEAKKELKRLGIPMSTINIIEFEE